MFLVVVSNVSGKCLHLFSSRVGKGLVFGIESAGLWWCTVGGGEETGCGLRSDRCALGGMALLGGRLDCVCVCRTRLGVLDRGFMLAN